MPLGWKLLQSYDGKIVSDHRRYSPLTDSYRDTYWTIGVWQHVHGVIEPCRNGLHMSPTPAEAWIYVQGDILAIVEGAGTSVNSLDRDNYAKSAHSRMRIIRAVALPRDICNTAEVKFGRDFESFHFPRNGEPTPPKLPQTDAYLRQVFKELPAIKPVQQ